MLHFGDDSDEDVFPITAVNKCQNAENPGRNVQVLKNTSIGIEKFSNKLFKQISINFNYMNIRK